MYLPVAVFTLERVYSAKFLAPLPTALAAFFALPHSDLGCEALLHERILGGRVTANAAALAQANAAGFTLNLSANNLEDADRLAALGAGPVVVVLPIDAVRPTRTPAGRFVSICPAAVRDDVTCATCGICAHPMRKAIIGFPSHGSGAEKAQAMFFQPRLCQPTMPI